MEAATPLPFSQVRVVGNTLRVDGLVVHDETAVRLAAEHDDPARLVSDAIEIGARVLDREQTGANADFVKAEFEKAAQELNVQFSDRARAVTDGMGEVISRHFGDESNEAVQHKVRQVVRDVSVEMQKELRAELLAEGDANPLAKFHRIQLELAKRTADSHSEQLRALVDKLEATRLEVERLRAEKEKVEELDAERERGTAKGRTYEEAVFAALEELAAARGDDCEAVGDAPGAAGKKGDVLVAIGGCSGPPQGSIVFEAKDERNLSRNKALEYLDASRVGRDADYSVLVVPSDRLPARTFPLKEFNGDKLFVTFDPDDGPLALEVAYGLARARVLMRRGSAAGLDVDALQAEIERAEQDLEAVRKIKSQLTGATKGIDEARSLVETMAGSVRGRLSAIDALVAAGAAAVD